MNLNDDDDDNLNISCSWSILQLENEIKFDIGGQVGRNMQILMWPVGERTICISRLIPSRENDRHHHHNNADVPLVDTCRLRPIKWPTLV